MLQIIKEKGRSYLPGSPWQELKKQIGRRRFRLEDEPLKRLAEDVKKES